MHVWQLDLDDRGWQTYCAGLAVDEEARAVRFFHDRDRDRYRHGRAVLRHLLAAYRAGTAADMLITYGRFGKPQLAGNTLFFNVSHSEQWALIAIARGELGVDIESLQRPGFDINALERHIATPRELEQLKLLPPLERSQALFRLWTQKEAWSKARGVGLQQDFSQLQVGIEGSMPPAHLFSLPVAAGFCASLCYPSHQALIHPFQLKP